MTKRWRVVLCVGLLASVSGAQEFAKPDTPPVVLSSTAPAYTSDAAAAKVVGDVLVSLVVDVNGNPTMMRVMRGLGHGLDEKALEAIRAYKFKPATKDGLPVPVGMYIKVNFGMMPAARPAAAPAVAPAASAPAKSAPPR